MRLRLIPDRWMTQVQENGGKPRRREPNPSASAGGTAPAVLPGRYRLASAPCLRMNQLLEPCRPSQLSSDCLIQALSWGRTPETTLLRRIWTENPWNGTRSKFRSRLWRSEGFPPQEKLFCGLAAVLFNRWC